VWGAAADGTILVGVSRANGSDLFRLAPGASSWSSVEKPPAFPGAGTAVELRSVAATRSRVVAVGVDARGRPLVMASHDSLSWSPLPFEDPKARLNAVAVGRGTFVIAGWRLIRGHAHLALWLSKTGARWRRIGGTVADPIGIFVAVAPDRGRFTAV